MTVYVDNMRARVGRIVFCHMWADTRAELFAMADRIGVARKWFQRPATVDLPGMVTSWEHFDIAMSKRALALAAGAIETDIFGPMEHTARLMLLSTDLAVRIRGVVKLQMVHAARERRK